MRRCAECVRWLSSDCLFAPPARVLCSGLPSRLRSISFFNKAQRLFLKRQPAFGPSHTSFTTTDSSIALPLSERPLSDIVSTKLLADIRNEARLEVRNRAAEFADPDRGPTTAELLVCIRLAFTFATRVLIYLWHALLKRGLDAAQKELDWLLDDTFGNGVWKLTLREDSQLPSRCSLDAIKQLWSQRLDHRCRLRCVSEYMRRLSELGASHAEQTDVCHRVPLQYLTNSADWREFRLAVGSGVLIPRPETALLVDFAQQVILPVCTDFELIHSA